MRGRQRVGKWIQPSQGGGLVGRWAKVTDWRRPHWYRVQMNALYVLASWSMHMASSREVVMMASMHVRGYGAR